MPSRLTGGVNSAKMGVVPHVEDAADDYELPAKVSRHVPQARLNFRAEQPKRSETAAPCVLET